MPPLGDHERFRFLLATAPEPAGVDGFITFRLHRVTLTLLRSRPLRGQGTSFPGITPVDRRLSTD